MQTIVFGKMGSPLNCKTEDLKAGEKQLSSVKLVQVYVLFWCLSISWSLVCNFYISFITLGIKQKERYN